MSLQQHDEGLRRNPCLLCLPARLQSQFGMEMWARWAHKALWHDYEPGWALHKSHHEPRVGPFEVSCLSSRRRARGA